jgi:hypothetical protein
MGLNWREAPHDLGRSLEDGQPHSWARRFSAHKAIVLDAWVVMGGFALRRGPAARGSGEDATTRLRCGDVAGGWPMTAVTSVEDVFVSLKFTSHRPGRELAQLPAQPPAQLAVHPCTRSFTLPIKQNGFDSFVSNYTRCSKMALGGTAGGRVALIPPALEELLRGSLVDHHDVLETARRSFWNHS